jgi:hypothetical protein
MTLLMRQIQRRIERKRRGPRHKLRELFSFHKNEQGQAMSEFCIILPLLLFLVFGIIQLMLITNASYLLNLANFYALRAGVANFEIYQYELASGTLENKMKDAAKDVLEPILPGYFTYHGQLTRMTIKINTAPDVSSISQNNRDRWLECQTSMSYHLFVPFAGTILAHIYHWGNWINTPWAGEGILVRRPFWSWAGHPLWPYIDMRTLNYDFERLGRSPSPTEAQIMRHKMAIGRRIYR